MTLDSSSPLLIQHQVLTIPHFSYHPVLPNSFHLHPYFPSCSLAHGSLFTGLPASDLPLPGPVLPCSQSEVSKMPSCLDHFLKTTLQWLPIALKIKSALLKRGERLLTNEVPLSLGVLLPSPHHFAKCLTQNYFQFPE